ncbi:hypothetical protein Meth11DRAFT_0992 [Methylophilaceae bacterium 11]|nr:hypothetical protein Meth11DRAFT_0992 [Methylophilaceae bacterium 11]
MNLKSETYLTFCMKNLLTSLIKKEGVHGLNTRLSWLPDLAHLDAISGIKLSIKHITSILNDSALSVSEKIHLLLLIEDANRSTLQQQLIAFIKLDNLKPEITHHIVDINYAYYRMVFLSYTKLIDISFNKPREQQPQQPIKLVMLSRAIMTSINMLKWRYFERAGPPANLWSQSNTLYQYAAEHQLNKAMIKPYADLQHTTIDSLLLQLWMLGNLNFSGLLKSQIETAAELLNLSMHDINLHSEWNARDTFFVELTKDHPARRIRKLIPSTYSLFWELDGFETSIQHALHQIHTHQTVAFKGTSLKHTYLLEETLTYLKKEWSRTGYQRQRRRELRHDIIRTASVSVGVSAVCDLLQQLDLSHVPVKNLADGSLTKRPVQTRVVSQGTTNTLMVGKEKWNILNESTLGLGTFVSQETSPAVKPNKLVAILTTRAHAKPAIGVIRNSKQMSGGKLKIGIELLTENPNLASLKKFEIKKETDTHEQTTSSNSLNVEFFAIFIPYHTLLHKPASLIMPKIEFLPRTFYEIHFNHKREIVKFDDPIEQGDDWVCVSFPEELS